MAPLPGSGDMLAVAFHGLARRRVRGSVIPGDALETMIGNLRALANALEAFNNYPPGAFFDTETLREISKRRRPADAEEDPGGPIAATGAPASSDRDLARDEWPASGQGPGSHGCSTPTTRAVAPVDPGLSRPAAGRPWGSLDSPAQNASATMEQEARQGFLSAR